MRVAENMYMYISRNKPKMAYSRDLPKMAVMDDGLAWTGMDWHGLALTGMDWHGLPWTSMDYFNNLGTYGRTHRRTDIGTC